MIESLITSSLIYNNHPVSDLNKKHKEQYLQGLGDMLSHLAKQNQTARFCYDYMCEALLGNKFPEGWACSNKMRNARKAQSLCREGLSFFRMNEPFWWDFYHIANLTGILTNDSEEIIKEAITPASKKKHYIACDFFLNGIIPNNTQSEFIRNQIIDQQFNSQPKKRILIVGTMSAGKSTIINTLVGHRIAKVKSTACTSTLWYLYNRPIDDGVYYSDGVYIEKTQEVDLSQTDKHLISIKFSGTLSESPLVLIDTPGLNYAYDETHRIITESAIKNGTYDSIICVINAPYIENVDEAFMINKVLSIPKKKKIFILNQLDRFDPEDDSIEMIMKRFKASLKKRETDALVVPISAKMAWLLKKECFESLTPLEKVELKQFKAQMSTTFFDMGMYGTGVCSADEDFFARSGLSNLESIIVSQ